MRKSSRSPAPSSTSRERVLHAAFEEFSRHGFHNVTIDAIAGRAGVAKGTVYLYFDSKEDLFASLFEHLLLETTTGLRTAIASEKDPCARVRAAIRFTVSYFANNRGIQSMMFTTSANLSQTDQDTLRHRVGKIMKENLDVLRSVFRDGIRKNVFKKADPADYSRILTGMVNGIVMSHMMAGRPLQVEKDVAMIYDVFTTGARLQKGAA
jgi:TetR/AcrR family transcriptional regulator, fatty acid metabolism regulator protein